MVVKGISLVAVGIAAAVGAVIAYKNRDKIKKVIDNVSPADVACMCVAGAGLVYTVVNGHRVTTVCDRLDKSIDDFSNSDVVSVDISDAIIEQAVKERVGVEAGYVANKVAKDAKYGIEKEINQQVKEAVNKQYGSIKEGVANEIKDRLGKIDISEVKDEVIEKAKDEAVKKFDGQLDDILDRYNNKLDSVSKVYTSLEKKFCDI